MNQQLISRVKFAELAGISVSGVTRACLGRLKAAVSGKFIDLKHPDVVAYLEKKQPGKHTGIDKLYEEAVSYCAETGRYSITGLQREFGIGYERAKKIVATMEIAGITKQAPAAPAPVVPEPEPEPIKAVHKRGTSAAPPPAAVEEMIEVPENIQAFADMPLRELIAMFGTDTRFVDWLNATQKIEAINEKRLKNATTEGLLVSRALVKAGVLDRIDATFTRMLTDGAKTISDRAHAITKSGGGLDVVHKEVEGLMGSFIRPAKVKMLKALNNA